MRTKIYSLNDVIDISRYVFLKPHAPGYGFPACILESSTNIEIYASGNCVRKDLDDVKLVVFDNFFENFNQSNQLSISLHV